VEFFCPCVAPCYVYRAAGMRQAGRMRGVRRFCGAGGNAGMADYEIRDLRMPLMENTARGSAVSVMMPARAALR